MFPIIRIGKTGPLKENNNGFPLNLLPTLFVIIHFCELTTLVFTSNVMNVVINYYGNINIIRRSSKFFSVVRSLMTCTVAPKNFNPKCNLLHELSINDRRFKFLRSLMTNGKCKSKW